MKPILYALLGLLAAPFTLGQTAPRNALAGTQKQNECSVAGMVVKLWRGAKPSKAQPCPRRCIHFAFVCQQERCAAPFGPT